MASFELQEARLMDAQLQGADLRGAQQTQGPDVGKRKPLVVVTRCDKSPHSVDSAIVTVNGDHSAWPF